MTREQVLTLMRSKEARRLFYTMELGGSVSQLTKLRSEGLISSCSRYGKGRQQDWYLNEQQHNSLSFLVSPPDGNLRSPSDIQGSGAPAARDAPTSTAAVMAKER